MSRKQRSGGRGKGGTKLATRPTTMPTTPTQKSSFTSTASYGPGTPPTPSVLFGREPRIWQYTPGTNLISYPRSSEPNSFQTLRDLSMAYDAVQMGEQVWFDIIRGLTPTVEPMPHLLKDGEDTGQYQDDIDYYEQLFAKPDGVTPILDFMCASVKDRLELGAMAFYLRKTRGGGFFALEGIDAATLKPLTDVYGRIPASPLPAYEQYLYGTPAGLYTTQDILYLPENRRTNSNYAISRVEMFITRINQALRKQSRDMARFTDGNLPDGLIELPAEIADNWTPKDLADFREQWNAMYQGNDRARAGARIGMPGTKYTKIDDEPITTDFDRFCLTIMCACMGITMSDLSFTETVNRATAEAQKAITYNRTVRPTVGTFEQLFTFIMHNVIKDTRFRYRFKGYEQADDWNALAHAHVEIVSTGIESPSDAAKALKVPSKSDLPRMVVTKDGPVVIDNFGNKAVQDKQLHDLLEPPQPPPALQQPQPNNQANDTSTQEKPITPEDLDGENATKGKPQGMGVKRADDAPVQTGMMIAFMLDSDTSSQLAVPGGEPVDQLHVTLAYLGDMTDIPPQGKTLAHMSPEPLKQTIAAYVRLLPPLRGQTGGVGRFINAGDETNPVWAGVNVPGLQKFRNGLVEQVEAMGYFVANDFDYTPHITLAYVPADADMPVERVPIVPLVFNRVCLCIGDEQTFYELGGNGNEVKG